MRKERRRTRYGAGGDGGGGGRREVCVDSRHAENVLLVRRGARNGEHDFFGIWCGGRKLSNSQLTREGLKVIYGDGRRAGYASPR
jgi:hypothetical protein